MELVYLEGDFTFITNESERLMIQDAYESMNKVEGGMDEMKKDPGESGYMFSPPSPIRGLITEELIKTRSGQLHSGASYGVTMRELQMLVRLGWNQYVISKLQSQ